MHTIKLQPDIDKGKMSPAISVQSLPCSMDIRVICSDIDGTLLNRDRQLSGRTIEVLSRIRDRHIVILASSRMPSAMVHLQKELGITQHPLIAYNGGYVLFPVENGFTVLESTTIPVDIVRKIVHAAGDDIHSSLYQRDEWYAPRFDQWTDREQRITKVDAFIEDNESVLTRWQTRGEGAHKVMCMGSEDSISALQARLEETLGSDLHLYRSRGTYLEIAPRSISKASGLQRVLDEYQLTMSAVIAFGDNYNDIEMLAAAAIGVAVANARPEVLAVARHITSASVEDGVAAALEKFLIH